MAMLCYKNGSLTRERVRDAVAGGSWDAFNALLAQGAPGGVVVGSGGYESWQWGSTPGTAAIVRGYVVINSAYNSKLRAGFGDGTVKATYRGELLLHELGHVMGLNHAQSSTQIMYPLLLARTRAAYGSGDLAGLARLGRATGCIPIPGNVGAPADMS